ncbi:MAG: 50S ribosomal protein L25 [Planctomycetes bacterium]|nr:50S ribosomal protein L25 [Planctomycetota bacterium]
MSHERPKLKATPRDRLGSKYAARLRATGQLPAVVYGHGQDPDHVALEAESFLHSLHEGAHLLDLDADGKAQTCLIKDVQYDYLGTNIIHVDLTRVDLSEEVEVSVPIELKGEDKSPGAKAANAVLEQPIVDLEVICRADSIPDAIYVDISAMNVDDAITVGDLKLPEGVRTEVDADAVVVSISLAAEETEAAPTEGAPTEPIVLTERKEEAPPAAEGKK